MAAPHGAKRMTLAVNATPASRAYVYLISCVAALSGLLFGFDTAVINGALPFLRDEFRLGDFQVELIAGVLLAGCIAGAGVAGIVSDRFGRRRALIVSAIVFAAASIASAIPRGLAELALARLAAGLAIRGGVGPVGATGRVIAGAAMLGIGGGAGAGTAAPEDPNIEERPAVCAAAPRRVAARAARAAAAIADSESRSPAS